MFQVRVETNDRRDLKTGNCKQQLAGLPMSTSNLTDISAQYKRDTASLTASVITNVQKVPWYNYENQIKFVHLSFRLSPTSILANKIKKKSIFYFCFCFLINFLI